MRLRPWLGFGFGLEQRKFEHSGVATYTADSALALTAPSECDMALQPYNQCYNRCSRVVRVFSLGVTVGLRAGGCLNADKGLGRPALAGASSVKARV